MRLQEFTESFDSRTPRSVIRANSDGTTVKSKIGNREIVFVSHIDSDNVGRRVAYIEFYERSSDAEPYAKYDRTGGGSEMKVFAFVIDCVKDTIIDYDPDIIEFTAVKSDGNRGRLYARIAKTIPGYKLLRIDDETHEMVYVYSKVER